MLDSYQKYNINFMQLENYELPSDDTPFILTINKDDVNFDFLIRIKDDSDKALVLGSGAYDATSDLEPPIFQRHKWIKHFDETLIFYNDPTLYLGEINMGWGFGTAERHFLEEMAEIIDSLLQKMNIRNEKVLFYGSSAGGFMSMLLGGFLKGSSVLVNNPQTIVWNYYDRHVNAMFQSAILTLSRDEIIERHTDRLNVIDFYKKINYVPSITYLQNAASERDLTHHLTPFILGLEQVDEKAFISHLDVKLYMDRELGHSPLRLNESLAYIRKSLAQLGNIE